MPLGMEVGLGPGHIVLNGTQLPLKTGAAPPFFGPCLLWPNGWIDQDAAGTEIDLGPGPGHIMLDGDPSPYFSLLPPERAIAPSFRLMSIVSKLSPISATAELLFWI